MKKLILTGLVCLAAFGAVEVSTPKAEAEDCSVVLCMTCPAGYVPAPTPGNCCRCVRA